MQALPKEFYCPLTKAVMVDPVMAPDKQTYERTAIVAWLNEHHTSPLTKQPMDTNELQSNTKLRETIAAHDHRPPVAPEELKVFALEGKDEMPLTLKLSTTQLEEERKLLHVSVIPQKEGKRKPAAVVCMLDNSGSMAGPGSIETATEVSGFSILDLVKHSVKTIVDVLSSDDYLSLISFSNCALILLDLVPMTPENKKLALEAVDSMEATYNTNIWDALSVALSLVKGSPICQTLNTSLWLFTDGEPNDNPPGGIVPSLQKALEGEKPAFTIHTFGFGYSLDSKLLFDLSTIGNGIFCYLPDCNLVGTTFVNCLANTLATAVNQATIRFATENVEELMCIGNGLKDGCIEVGPVQYGQTRDFVVQFKAKSNAPWSISASCRYRGGEVVAQVQKMEMGMGDSIGLYRELSRCQCSEVLSRVLQGALGPQLDTAFLKQLEEFLLKWPSKNDEEVKALLQDLVVTSDVDGRVAKAFSNQERIQRWGQHYVRSLVRAYQQQLCHNFKDPGVQLFGGPLFKELQHLADRTFCTLPAPTRSIENPITVLFSSYRRYVCAVWV